MFRNTRSFSLKVLNPINVYLVDVLNRGANGENVNSEVDMICGTCRSTLIRERNRVVNEMEIENNQSVQNSFEVITIDANIQNVSESGSENASNDENNEGNLLLEADVEDEASLGNEVDMEDENASETEEHMEDGNVRENNAAVDLSISRSANTHTRCIFKCVNGETLKNVPPSVRRILLIQYNFYIPPSCKWCQSHTISDNFDGLINRTQQKFSNTMLNDMFNMMKSMVTERQNGFVGLDLESERVIKQWTGLSKENFNQLLVISELNSQQLFIYLAKLRTGTSNERLATLFNITRSTAEYRMNKARDALSERFMHAHLGLEHVNRDILKHNMTDISRALFCENSPENIISIWDATYVYIQKSSNYEFQRRTYSMHKRRPLIKPMMVVSPNGYILEVFGPYPANLNDAEILKKILSENNSLRETFIENDVFLVDRGFRDSISALQTSGYVACMPHFIDTNATQLTWRQANKSRFVTKCRYAVEVINGRLKSVFKYFNNVWNNQSVPHLITDFKLAAALHNAFFDRFETDIENSEEIIKLMIERLNIPNFLADLVLENNLSRKPASFTDINDCEIEFPFIDEEELKLISLGSYQIKQSRSYYAEHVKLDGKYRIQAYKHTESFNLSRYNILAESPSLLRARIQSRHSNQTKYFMYILLDQAVNGKEGILGYYCQCKNGQRTVGCCSHVMTVIWYFAFAKYTDDLKHPAQFLDSIFDSAAESDDE